MTTLNRPGAVLHYEVWGAAGAWVTLVNGHTRPLNDFRMLGKHLVEQGFRVLALDNRGSGQTTTGRAFTLAEMADDVEALWEELGIAKTMLLGISMGGFISQTLAMTRPDRIERLVLVSTAMNQTRVRVDETPWSHELPDNEAKLSSYFTKDFAARNAMMVTNMAKQITRNVVEGRFGENSELQKAAVKGFDATARIEQGAVKAKTLVVHGEQDGIIPFEAAGETFKALIAGGAEAKLESYEGSGHLLLAERPKELYRTVAEWFLVLALALLASPKAQAVQIYSLYEEACKATSGAIIDADDDQVSLLKFDGTTARVSTKAVQLVARYDVLENPFPRIGSTTGGPALLNVTSESSEGAFRAFATDFFENLVLFLDEQGKIRVVEVDEIVSIVRDEGQNKAEGKIVAYRPTRLNPPPGRSGCPPVSSAEKRESPPVDRVATQVMADKLRIDSFLTKLKTGFRDLESLRERTLFYARPLLFNEQTRLGILAARGNREGRYPVAASLDTVPLYLEFGSGQAYRFQSSTSFGNRSWRMVPDVKPIAAVRSEFKSHLLHGIFLANLSGFAAGKSIYAQSWDAFEEEGERRKTIWMDTSFNHLTLLGADYGPWSLSYGYYFPVFALGKGDELREVTSPRLSPVFRFGYQRDTWQVEVFLFRTDFEGDVTTDVADATYEDQRNNDKFVRYYSDRNVVRDAKLTSTAVRTDLTLFPTSDLQFVGDLSYRKTRYEETALRRNEVISGWSNDTSDKGPFEGSDSRNVVDQSWIATRVGVRTDMGQWIALGAEAMIERAKTTGDFPESTGKAHRVDEIHTYAAMMEFLL